MMISTRRDLLEEASNIGDLKKYNMLLQNISLSSNVKNYLNNNRKNEILAIFMNKMFLLIYKVSKI